MRDLGSRIAKDMRVQVLSPAPWLLSSVVEQSAVNRCVVGSNPTGAANLKGSHSNNYKIFLHYKKFYRAL